MVCIDRVENALLLLFFCCCCCSAFQASLIVKPSLFYCPGLNSTHGRRRSVCSRGRGMDQKVPRRINSTVLKFFIKKCVMYMEFVYIVFVLLISNKTFFLKRGICVFHMIVILYFFLCTYQTWSYLTELKKLKLKFKLKLVKNTKWLLLSKGNTFEYSMN